MLCNSRPGTGHTERKCSRQTSSLATKGSSQKSQKENTRTSPKPGQHAAHFYSHEGQRRSVRTQLKNHTDTKENENTARQSIRTTPKAGLKPRFEAADASDRKEEKSSTTSVSMHELGRGRKSRAEVGVTDNRKRRKSWLFNTINR